MLRQNFSNGKTDRPIYKKTNKNDHSHTLKILFISTNVREGTPSIY